jgi:NAD(P)-dependent dehydrogenase (short-subunit alcohol dehydrogenase family)
MTDEQLVIIGGSEGIGLAVVKAARVLGARVRLASRTRDKLAAAQDAVNGLEIQVADINNNTASIREALSGPPIVDHMAVEPHGSVGVVCLNYVGPSVTERAR